MKESLENEIKAHLIYTEEQKRCDECRYYVEVENKHVDRMWDSKCNYAGNLGNINVKPNAYCSKFDHK